MHETAAAKKVAEEIISKRKNHAILRIGKMYGDKKRILALVNDFLSGTPYEGANIDAEEIDVAAKCDCGFSGKIDVVEHVHFVRCPKCNKVAEITGGNELKIIE